MVAAVDRPLRTQLTHFLGTSEIAGVAEGPVRVAAASISGAFLARLGPSFETKVLLDAQLGYAAGILGFVWGDSIVAQRGVYLKSGAVDAGQWTWIGPLPEGNLSLIEAEIDAIWTAINIGFAAIDEWQSGVAVEAFQALTDDYKIYLVLVDHITDSIVNDLADDNIKVVFDFSLITSEALSYRDAAEGFRDEAEDFKDDAEAAALTAAAVSGSGAFQEPRMASSILTTNQEHLTAGRAINVLSRIPLANHAGIAAGTDTNTWNTEINAAIAAAITAKVDVFFPAGRYLIEASLTFGLIASAGTNGFLRIYGEGPRSIIKRNDNAEVEDFAQILRLTAATGVSYEVDHLKFDANGTGTPQAFDHPTHPLYAHEHAATIGWGGSGLIKFLNFHDLWFVDRIGAEHIAIYILYEYLTINNILCSGSDWTKHSQRPDIFFSRIGKETIMSNVLCDSVEAEVQASANITDGAKLWFTNIQMRIEFDWGSDGNSLTADYTYLFMDNCSCGWPEVDPHPLVFVNIYRTRGVMQNCRFAGIAEIRDCFLTMENCHFHIGGQDGDATTADHIQLLFDDNSAQYLKLINPTFWAAAGVVNGSYLQTTAANHLLDARIDIINANVKNELEYSFRGIRSGTMLVDGGNLKGTIAAVEHDLASGAYSQHTILKNMEHWTAAAAVEATFLTGAANQILSMYGVIDGEVCEPYTGGAGGPSGGIFNVDCRVLVSSDPNGRLRGAPGMIARLRSNPERRWVYGSDSYAGLTIWYPIGEHPDVALTDAATIAVNMSNGNNFVVTLGGDRALGAPTNARPNQKGRITFIQDAIGSRTLNPNVVWLFPGGPTNPTLSTAPGAVDTFTYQAIAKKMGLTFTGGSASISSVGHGLQNNHPVMLETTGALPPEFNASTVYYLRSSGLTLDAFILAAAVSSNTSIVPSTAGTGVHSFVPLRANRIHAKFDGAFA